MIKPWLFEFFHAVHDSALRDDPAAVSAHIRRYLDLWVDDEAVSAYTTPWRVAEEFAMLDHLTGGRLEMGVVSGIPYELAVVGIGREQAAQAHSEIADVLLDAVTKPVVTHRGEHFSFEDVRLTPPFPRSAPPVWTAATSEASARRAPVSSDRSRSERSYEGKCVRASSSES